MAGSPGLTTRWFASLGLGPSPLTNSDWSWDNASDLTIFVGESKGVFTRGLLFELEVTLGEWYTISTTAFSAWPIKRARATDVPGLSFEIHQLANGWRLTGKVRVLRRKGPLTGHGVPNVIAPGAVLVDDATEWTADQFFADRAALIAEIAKKCVAIRMLIVAAGRLKARLKREGVEGRPRTFLASASCNAGPRGTPVPGSVT